MPNRDAYFDFRHPVTGVEVKVHPLEVGLAMIYVRHGWGLKIPESQIIDASVS